MPLDIPNGLIHITDVGAPSGDGIDSILRIEKQYRRLGVLNPRVISAGQSPLHVAFAATTDLAPQALDNAAKTRKLLSLDQPRILPTALNSAPRNSETQISGAKEDYIYRVRSGENIELIYGPEVVKWINYFRGQIDNLEVIKSIGDFIPNTSSGSQFRSVEYMPIAHVLEAAGILENHSTRDSIDPETIEPFSLGNKNVLIVPPDEYGNGRLVTENNLWEAIMSQNEVSIPGLTQLAIKIRQSLTNVVPGQISIWPSSNHFPNQKIKVLNIGTRWKNGTTRLTDTNVRNLASKLSASTGRSYEVDF